jgi:hypothetical protein
MRIVHAIEAGIIVVALSAAGLADTLVLKNGKKYTGVFISASAGRVHFNAGAEGTHTFRTRDVQMLQFGTDTGARELDADAVPATPRATRPAAAGEDNRSAPAAQPTAPEVQASTPAAPAPAAPAPATPAAAPLYPAEGSRTTPFDATGAVDSAYTGAGGPTGILGPPRASEQTTADGRAAVRQYQNGVIYYTPQGGAHAMYGPIYAAWMQSGGENSRLGYPTSDQRDDYGGFSRTQSFERGSITWTQNDGPRIQYVQAP